MRVYGFTTTVILALILISSTAQGAGAATISGRMLMKNGIPISGGIAIAFDLKSSLPPAPEKYFQPPDYTEKIQNDGSFQMLLPQGEYSIGAIKRRDGRARPPREGDILFILRDGNQNIKRIVVPEKGHIELGDLAAGEIFRPVSDPLYRYTTVTGRVTDVQGKPAKDVIVSAVLIKQGVKDMLFFAQEPDSNGNYILKLPFGDTYKLGIWETTGSPEVASKNFKKKIQIKTGDTLQNLDLQMQ